MDQSSRVGPHGRQATGRHGPELGFRGRHSEQSVPARFYEGRAVAGHRGTDRRVSVKGWIASRQRSQHEVCRWQDTVHGLVRNGRAVRTDSRPREERRRAGWPGSEEIECRNRVCLSVICFDTANLVSSWADVNGSWRSGSACAEAPLGGEGGYGSGWGEQMKSRHLFAVLAAAML